MHDEHVINMLRTIKPSPSQASAVAAAYEAGRRSAGRMAIRWRIASGALGAAMIVIVASSFRPNETISRMPHVVSESVPVVFAKSMPQTVQASDAPAAFLLTRLAIDQGIDALPRHRSGPAATPVSPSLRPSDRAFNRGDL